MGDLRETIKKSKAFKLRVKGFNDEDTFKMLKHLTEYTQGILETVKESGKFFTKREKLRASSQTYSFYVYSKEYDDLINLGFTVAYLLDCKCDVEHKVTLDGGGMSLDENVLEVLKEFTGLETLKIVRI